MTRKQRRGLLIGGGVTVLAFALVLVLVAMRDTVVFFYTPSDLAEKSVKPGQRIRIGGLVAEDSVIRGGGLVVRFGVTDTVRTVKVSYDGILPDLFREGQGVVAEGKLNSSGSFIADSVLAKHDENYMPPEVASALKEKGIKLGKSARHPSDNEKARQ